MSSLYYILLVLSYVTGTVPLVVTSVTSEQGAGIGDFVTISMTTTPDTPPATCEWEKFGLDGRVTHLVPDGVKYVINKPLEISIYDSQLEDTGFYRCFASNVNGSSYSPYVRVTVNMADIPTVSGPSSHGSTSTIEAATLSTQLPCEFSPFDDNITVRWLHVDTCGTTRYVNMSNDAKYSGSNATHPTLVINDVGASDLGSYWCQVTNTYGSASAFEIVLSKAVPPMLCLTSYSPIPVSTEVTSSLLNNCSAYSAENQALYIHYKETRALNGLIMSYVGVQSPVLCSFICLRTDSCTCFNHHYPTAACQLMREKEEIAKNQADWNLYAPC